MYEKFDGDLVLQTPILEVLEYFRMNGHPEIDTKVYRKSGRDIFLRSPFRDEKTASFAVMVDTNCWKDFGSGEGAGVLDLVVKLSGKPRNEAFLLLAEISKVPRTYVEERLPERRDWKKVEAKSALEVISVLACFTDEPLIRYAKSRGIDKKLLDRYCYQISYHSLNYPQYYHTNIGFPNTGGGYAYRGPNNNYDKGCTSRGVTVINRDGRYDMNPSSEAVVVFEGFFDFLSYMQFNHDRAVSGEAAAPAERVARWMDYTPVSDILVLNSVTNVDMAMDYLGRHNVVNCCLDNDRAGKTCYDTICERLPLVSVVDRSVTYSPCNDFNEYLMELKKQRESNGISLKH